MPTPQVSAGCRDTVAGAIKATMGPENPHPQECAEQGSMTCSLYGSAVTVTGGAAGPGAGRRRTRGGPAAAAVGDAIKDQEAAAASLEKVRTDLGASLTALEPARTTGMHSRTWCEPSSPPRPLLPQPAQRPRRAREQHRRPPAAAAPNPADRAGCSGGTG